MTSMQANKQNENQYSQGMPEDQNMIWLLKFLNANRLGLKQVFVMLGGFHMCWEYYKANCCRITYPLARRS